LARSKKKAAVFLDRDGTLIEDVGFLKHIEDIQIFPDTIEALKKLQQNYELFVVSNQTGVAAGSISLEDVDRINGELDRRFAAQGIRINEWYSCPHGPQEGCQCRKPRPGFLLEADKKYGVDFSRSFVIGDHPHDVATGRDLGVFGLYLLSGHGRRHLSDLGPHTLVFHCIDEAAEWILQNPLAGEDLERSLEAGARAIKEGGLVAFPTETVYGLGADAFNEEAVRRIFKAKKRPLHNPLIVHIAVGEDLYKLSESLPESTMKLVDRFWPGPLTLVLPKSSKVPDIVTADNPSVAVRMPAHYLARRLIKLSGTPVAAPSANSFGRTSPTSAAHVRDQLEGLYDVLIDGGSCWVGVESTVLSLTGDRPRILRPGGVTREEIESLIGPVDVSSGHKAAAPESPGQLPSHYAPDTRLILLDNIPEEYLDDPEVGYILPRPLDRVLSGPVELLSKTGNLEEAAGKLYAALRRLDRRGLRLIVAQSFPDEAIGVALNDRLSKAAAEKKREP